MASNYEKMLQGAQALFLEKDQPGMIGRWGLEHDDDWLYVRYFGERLRIHRRTAALESLEGAGTFRPGNYVNEGMVLFDLLTLSPDRPRTAGRWASISTLGGIIGAGHDRTRMWATSSRCSRISAYGFNTGRATTSFLPTSSTCSTRTPCGSCTTRPCGT